MRVVLLKPRNPCVHDSAVIPSVGLACLAARVRAADHQVEILDAVKEGWTVERTVAELRRGRGHVYGISCFSNNLGAGLRVAQSVREDDPEALIVVGGPHATFEPQDVLAEPSVDVAVVSEGEEALPRLVDLFREGRHRDPAALDRISNLVFRAGGGLRRTPVRRVPDLDALGLPAWDLVRPETYPLAPHGLFSRSGRTCPMVATRGCPYPCIFCGAGRIMGTRLRKRSPASLLEEIRLLHERHGIREFHFLDDNFTLDAAWALRVCETIIEEGPRILWSLTNGVRLDSLNEALVRAMERSGCYSMGVGIESGSAAVLQRIRKGITLPEVREKVSMIKRVSGIRVVGFFILGFPFETRDDMERTIREARKLFLDAAYFGNYVPFPGSPLYEELKASGTLASLRWEGLCLEYRSPLLPDGVEPEEMRKLMRRAFFSFYLRPRILLALLRDLRSVRQTGVFLSRVRRILFRG